MTTIQISKIQLRRGQAMDLPGAPLSLDPPVQFSDALDDGELGFTSDQGRLFIGQLSATQGMSNYNRTVYPYRNIEVITENTPSLGVMLRPVIRDNQDGFFGGITSSDGIILAPALTSTDWKTLALPTVTGPQTLYIDLVAGANALIEYFIFDLNNQPVRSGTLSVMWNPTWVNPPECVDDATIDIGNISDLQWRAFVESSIAGNHLVLQYLNRSGYLNMWFRMDRPALEETSTPFPPAAGPTGPTGPSGPSGGGPTGPTGSPGPTGPTGASTGTFNGGTVTGRTGFASSDWLTPLVNWPVNSSHVYALSPDGRMALTGAAQTGNGGSTAYPVAIGVSGFGFHNLVTNDNKYGAWGGYFEARQYPGANTYAYGIEVEIANVSGADAPNTASPYVLPSPTTIGINLASGAGVSLDTPPLAANTAEVAIWIGKNDSTFNKGIVFHASGLTGTNGDGTGTATALSLGTGHTIEWTKPDNTPGPAIFSVQSSGAPAQLVFDNDVAYFRSGSLPMLGLSTITSPGPGSTSLALRVSNNAGYTYVPVTVGPPDSGGAGYRMLRVPN